MKKLKPFVIEFEALECTGVIVDYSDGEQTLLEVAITPYICKYCPNIHVNMQLSESAVLQLYLTERQAELLADKLRDPFLDPTVQS